MFHVPAHKNVAAPAGGVYLKAALQFGGHIEYVGVLSNGKAWSADGPDSFYVYEMYDLAAVIDDLKAHGMKAVL